MPIVGGGYAKAADPKSLKISMVSPISRPPGVIGLTWVLLVLLMPTITLSFDPFFKYVHKTHPNVKNLVYGVANAGTFTRMVTQAVSMAEATGFEVVGGETLDYSWTDFNPFMTALLEHKPDAIFIIHGCGPDLVAVEIKATRQMGFKGPIISFGSANPAYQNAEWRRTADAGHCPRLDVLG